MNAWKSPVSKYMYLERLSSNKGINKFSIKTINNVPNTAPYIDHIPPIINITIKYTDNNISK